MSFGFVSLHLRFAPIAPPFGYAVAILADSMIESESLISHAVFR